MEGRLRGARDKAAVIAEYLYKVQFGKEGQQYVTPPVLRNVVFSEYIYLDYKFVDTDLIYSLRQLKNKKSARPNGIPNEIWKLLINNKELRTELLVFLNRCLESAQVPERWEIGEVVSIFKKKDPKLHENYRPITLLDTIYKIYTRLLANRLSRAVDPLLRKSQFGFRKRRSTSHATHVLRRTIEGLFHKTDKDLNLLFLDWSKAFDRVNTAALSDALMAFGIGGAFLNAIQSTFTSKFRVLGQRGFPDSELKVQEVGIRQGCPLSPFLFVVMLSWLMAGVDNQHKDMLGEAAGNPLPVPDIFYADDTIFLSTSSGDLQARFGLLEELAALVGLRMNREKTVLMLAKVKSKQTTGSSSISATNRNVKPFSIYYKDGTLVKIVEAEDYLGSRITRNIAAKVEIKRRVGLGLVRAGELKRLWQGTGITRKRKIELVDSLIGSKVMYGLETLNTTTKEDDSIDAMQRRVYRRALGLAPPYVAQQKGLECVKNNELLLLTKSIPWSTRVKIARVRLLNECRTAHVEEPIRKVVFDSNLRPIKWDGRVLPGVSPKRGTWLSTALRNEQEI